MIIHCPHCNKGNRVPAEKLNQTPVCGACQQELLSLPINATTANFSELVTQSTMPVIVDFWAPWCGPCRQLAPIIEELAKEHPGRVFKLNVDHASDLAAKFGIRSIPTLLFMKNGSVVETLVGVHSKSTIEDKLK
jgi:thioredoxin 2